MDLSKIPKTFNLKELKKGFFPHLFNIPENQNYIGPMPDKKFYNHEFMNVKDRDNFFKWYDQLTDKSFNFQKELFDYCSSDVDILAKACISFRSLFMSITKRNEQDTGVDPFAQCITLPSACHYVYRRNFMKSQSIGIIPTHGYNCETTSFKAIKWLKYIMMSEKLLIQHARNGIEKKIYNYKVDGWCEQTKTVYEFNGCFFHGCPICYKPETFNVMKNETMGEIFAKHLIRINKIQSAPNVKEVIEMWECSYEKKIQQDKDFACFVENEMLKKPLEPRDALAGGRTNAFILYHVGKMGYVDFTSLYPYIQKYGRFPLGHPEIIMENFGSIENYFGLIFCKVLPPSNLYIPVLPYKTNNKLMFPLCR
jgi:hypothetical protein